MDSKVYTICFGIVVLGLGGKMGRYQRVKGASFEREIANFLKGNGFPTARRGIGQARCGREVPDVDGTSHWVECKVGARPNVKAAIAQAEAATDGRPIAVVVKWDQGKPYILFDMYAFFRYLKDNGGI